MAVKIIKNDLRTFVRTANADTYPSTDDIQNCKWIPNTLRLLLSSLIQSELKVESIGQCIMKAAMSRSALVPPILFGLGVEVDHKCGLNWLSTELFRLGFAVSYGEVYHFMQYVVMTENMDDILQSRASENSFTTFIADNVDHTVCTLDDGHSMFHGMGVMAATTNKGNHQVKEVPRKRLKQYVKADDLVKAKGIPITTYDFPKKRGLDSIIFKSYEDLIFPFLSTWSSSVDKLWHTAGLFTMTSSPRANWSGFMQDISTGNHPKKANITMLPLIDLNPNDETCIYSTLLYIIEQSKRLNIEIPSVMFDQTLWLKALEIVTEKSLEIVPLLGGFHLLMSFYGSIT